MPMDFGERREAERRARGNAFRQAGLTLARVVDRATISTAAGASSEGTASPSATSQVQTMQSPPPPRAGDRQKGKEPVVVTSKWTHDDNEDKPPRKRPSGIRLSEP